MNLNRYKQVRTNEVMDWLENDLKLTKEQLRIIADQELVRFAPFEFYKPKKRTNNLFLRLTGIFYPFIWFLIFISLPLNYIITGYWGYSSNKLKWFYNWSNKIGL